MKVYAMHAFSGNHASYMDIVDDCTCKACMSKMTTLVGPPRESGMLDRILASVTAVATSPSASTCKNKRNALIIRTQ